MKDLIDLPRRPVEEVIAGLQADGRGASTEAGSALVGQAKDLSLIHI